MIAGFQPPPALRARDRVAVIAPASGFDRASFEAGLALIGARYRAVYGPGIFERHRYLAGDDSRRLAELDARTGRSAGAGGVLRPRRLRRDASAGAAGRRRPPRPTEAAGRLLRYHGAAPVAAVRTAGSAFTDRCSRSWDACPAATRERLFTLLEGHFPPRPRLAARDLRRRGGRRAAPRRQSVGVHAVLGHALHAGARWRHPAARGPGRAALPPRPHVDAPAAGRSVRPRARHRARHPSRVARKGTRPTAAPTCCASWRSRPALPCAAGFPIGHGEVNEPVPLGVRVRLDADARRLTFLEAAVAG